MEGLREVTADYGVPLIFDEVVTGFRMAYGGAQEYYNIIPDMSTYGKVIGGGMPLAAVAGSEEIMSVCNSFKTEKSDFVSMVGTLSGNPIAVTAGLTALDIVGRPGFYEKVRATGQTLMAALKDAFTRADISVQVSGMETCFDVYFTDQPIRTYRDGLKADTRMLAKYKKAMLDHGILKGGQKFYIGACHTEEDVRETIKIFESVAEVLKKS